MYTYIQIYIYIYIYIHKHYSSYVRYKHLKDIKNHLRLNKKLSCLSTSSPPIYQFTFNSVCLYFIYFYMYNLYFFAIIRDSIKVLDLSC